MRCTVELFIIICEVAYFAISDSMNSVGWILTKGIRRGWHCSTFIHSALS